MNLGGDEAGIDEKLVVQALDSLLTHFLCTKDQCADMGKFSNNEINK